jgi:V/A-type H+-transporting ATPase subunit I
MFAAVRMVRVRIQVAARDSAAATHAIAKLGLLHLIDIAHGRNDAAPAGNAELLAAHRALRDRLRRVLDRLGVVAPPLAAASTDPPIVNFEIERQRLASALDPIEEAVDGAWSAREHGLADAASAERSLRRAEALRRSGFDPEGLIGVRFICTYVIDAVETALASLSDFLSPTPHRIEVLDTGGVNALAVVMTPASSRSRLDAALRLVHVEAIEPAMLAPQDRVSHFDAALTTARRVAAGASRTLATLSDAHAGSLGTILARADTCVLLLQAQEQFGSTGRFVVISGWMPANDAERLKGALIATVPRAIVDVEAPATGLEAPGSVATIPILHRNPVLLRPFQPLVDMYDTPSYRELQPTAFFAVSFLLMFGLMFGDVGHGTVLCAAGYYLFRYVPRFLDYGILLMEAGIASAIFGALYGSLFGIEGALPVLWLEPMHDLPSFMRIAVGLGIALVSIGLVLNVVNSWRLGERSAAFFGVHGLFGAFLYWTSVALVARVAMPASFAARPWMIVTLAAGAGTLLLLRAPLVRRLARDSPVRPSGPRPPVWLRALEGSVELVDALFAYFANTVSFIRIAAFAAVHAGVFIAMFAVSDALAQTRFGSLLAIAALIVGNAVLVLLEGLTITVQVLRLEYYEFFGKFFRGGGHTYRPLMLTAVETKEGTS